MNKEKIIYCCMYLFLLIITVTSLNKYNNSKKIKKKPREKFTLWNPRQPHEPIGIMFREHWRSGESQQTACR
jgi:hypothetical protein